MPPVQTKLTEFPRVDVVEASAGSGKTYALARRYVQLVMDPRLRTEEAPLRSILAVTFTNKATIEMKQRILEFLKKIALDAFTDDREKNDILSSLALKGGKAKARARDIMEDIVNHYNFFQVQTIDSFINSLLSGCSFRLGFASNFRIRDDYRPYLEYSLDSLIDRLPTDDSVRRAFNEFLEYYLFVENREGWFSKNDMLGLMRALYNYSNTYGGIFLPPDADIDDMWKKKKKIIGLVKEICEKAPEETHAGFMSSAAKFLENNKTTFDIDKLSAYFAREEFPIKKGAAVPREVARLWSALRKDLTGYCEWESRAVFKPYIEIFNEVLDDFRKISGGDDVIFLPELNTYARLLVGDPTVSVAELYYRLATRFHHYLIDEFQDTSRLQWKNISPMVDEALSSGGSLFYVGDKKQAIYRFRGGDVSLFDSVQAQLKDFNPEQKALTKNYRSQKEVVGFNNDMFSQENLGRFLKAVDSDKNPVGFTGGDIGRILKIFSDSRQEWKEENAYGYVKLEALDAASVDERDSAMRAKLIPLIRGLEKRFPDGDIAVLARENADVELFTSWLIEEEIPVESEKTLNIREHPLIKELISFLMFLNSPIDNLSFASFILGGIFQRASGIEAGKMHDFLFRMRPATKKEKGIYLYREFRKEFPEAWDARIEEFFRSVGFVPLYELMISVLARFRVMENFPEYQGFFMRLLGLIKDREDEYSGISSFLEYFASLEDRELYVNVASADAVKVMTMHKAKGLEFPVVIIPFVEMDVAVGTGGISRRPYVVKQLGDNTLALAQLKKKYGAYSARLAAEYREEYVKALIDELNALYVALTRAKHEMYLFIPAKSANKANPARLLMPYETLERGSKRKYPPEKTKTGRPPELLPASKYSDWIGILKEEFVETSELINRERIRRGNMLHLILSCVGNLRDGKPADFLMTARERLALEFPRARNTEEYLSIAESALENKNLSPVFYVEKGDVYREKEIVDRAGNTKRIDRLIITPEEAWIIDYKSSREGGAGYEEQIREYKGIVGELYPRLKVRGFLVYLDDMTIEEVNG